MQYVLIKYCTQKVISNNNSMDLRARIKQRQNNLNAQLLREPIQQNNKLSSPKDSDGKSTNSVTLAATYMKVKKQQGHHDTPIRGFQDHKILRNKESLNTMVESETQPSWKKEGKEGDTEKKGESFNEGDRKKGQDKEEVRQYWKMKAIQYQQQNFALEKENNILKQQLTKLRHENKILQVNIPQFPTVNLSQNEKTQRSFNYFLQNIKTLQGKIHEQEVLIERQEEKIRELSEIVVENRRVKDVLGKIEEKMMARERQGERSMAGEYGKQGIFGRDGVRSSYVQNKRLLKEYKMNKFDKELESLHSRNSCNQNFHHDL